jgi:hypothetical protein
MTWPDYEPEHRPTPAEQYLYAFGVAFLGATLLGGVAFGLAAALQP